MLKVITVGSRSVSLKCMLKLLYNFGNICYDLHCVVFYNITKIALAFWLAERHDCTRVCKHSCDLKIRCCEGRVYLFYPFPWLFRLGKYLQTCWTKVFFLVSWHSKRVKPIWFEIVFQLKQTWLLCTILSNFCLIALANYHASTCKTHQVYLIYQFSHLTSLHSCLEFSQRPLVFTSGYANTENVYRVFSFFKINSRETQKHRNTAHMYHSWHSKCYPV